MRGVRQRGQEYPSPYHPTTCAHTPGGSCECPPNSSAREQCGARLPPRAVPPPLVPVIYQPHVGCERWHWHLPQVTPDPPDPLRAPSSRWGLWGGSLSQPWRVRRKRRDIQSLGWARALPGSRGHRARPGALPPPLCPASPVGALARTGAEPSRASPGAAAACTQLR